VKQKNDKSNEYTRKSYFQLSRSSDGLDYRVTDVFRNNVLAPRRQKYLDPEVDIRFFRLI